jgi:hypothetical protein
MGITEGLHHSLAATVACADMGRGPGVPLLPVPALAPLRHLLEREETVRSRHLLEREDLARSPHPQEAVAPAPLVA